MTLPEDKRQSLKRIVEDMLDYADFISGTLEDYEDAESYKNASYETKMATERAITGLRQHMVSACREILHYEIGEKPHKRKKSITKCIENGYISDNDNYTEAFSFGEVTAKTYGEDVNGRKIYNGISGLPKIYRKFCQDILDYLSDNT